MALSKILGMMGVNVSEQDIKMLETIIPQLPAKLNEWGGVVNKTLLNFHERLLLLEQETHANTQKLDRVLEILERSKLAHASNGPRQLVSSSYDGTDVNGSSTAE